MKANFKKIMLVAVLFVCLALVVAVALYIGKLTENGNGNIPEGESDPESTMKAIYIDGEKYYPRLGVRNYLIMGIDKEMDSEKRGQSDFIMILSLDLNKQEYTVVSVNRDTMVEVDHYNTKEEKGVTKVEQIALSHAYGKKDVTSNAQKCNNTALSVSRLFKGMHFDGYISMTMDAVEVIVDTIGGVEVFVEDDLSSYDERLVKGETVMLDGKLALTFIRARQGVPDNANTNIARMRRQETFLKVLFTKLGDESVISSSIESYEEIAEKLVSNMEPEEQLELATRVSEYERKDSLTPDGEPLYNEKSKLIEFYVSEDSIKKILKEVFYEKAN